MPKLSKRMQACYADIDRAKLYPVEEALSLVKDRSKVKFVEGVELSVNLGVDPRKSDQVVRGAVTLPHGTGRTVRVAVFAQGDKAAEATEAGANIVGFDDLAETIKGGEMNFDVLIATPDAMRHVGQLGQILGPRGLMPNPKVGTVTQDVKQAVLNAKAGQARFRTDKAGIIHCRIGAVNFDVDNLKANIESVLAELKKLKPSSSKGTYVKKVTVSSTMGPGVAVDPSTLKD
ncbi:MAG: 50S ribosomal protein L1 [Gammaproteobacteria bacterium CG11_big_fil_rev_8_21_14_0_20_46_22]|nr:MAG: 50S ribosomal protein L1 [Gammaproteobacteria bacterium CG12_big_fil_rev_8_21_14_0_65_46_12]PIR11593.1 MAG: 50S ribosomal protein L1 [Gammaproteobacteria bacterium CG11_big_fil_rev_8_21_14_0_20_46_22]